MRGLRASVTVVEHEPGWVLSFDPRAPLEFGSEGCEVSATRGAPGREVRATVRMRFDERDLWTAQRTGGPASHPKPLREGDVFSPFSGLRLAFHCTPSVPQIREYQTLQQQSAWAPLASIIGLDAEGRDSSMSSRTPTVDHVAELLNAYRRIHERIAGELSLAEVIALGAPAEAEIEVERRLENREVPVPNAVIEVVLPDASIQRANIFDAPIRIGRAVDNDVIVPGPKMSRRHCTLAYRGGALVVERGDRGGDIWSDGERLADGPVRIGQLLVFGGATVRCTFVRRPNF